MTIVLGVDPGTATTGYGVVARAGDGAVSLLECGVIRTDAGEALPRRLRDIYEGIGEVIARHPPDIVAVEGVFYARNVRTTVVLGHTRGAILLAAALRDLPVVEYSPAEIKSAIVGTGRATKEQIQYMVQRLLRLKTAPRPADAADAVAVALCHCYANTLRRLPEPMRFRATAIGRQP
ncbi:MAG TPA: crossover junction endodeoxyribonuclease RuvC [Longimicrobiales bacterium]